MNSLFDFLFQTDSHDSVAARQDLTDWGVDMKAVDSEVARILAGADRASKLSWIVTAKEKQERFERKIEEQSQRIWDKYNSTPDLLAAVMSGKLGQPVQAHANVFFRNRKPGEISETDLRSFIEDCELLKLL